MKKIYILDTSVYLTSANAVFEYGKNDVVVPVKVLEELDGHKNRQDMVGFNARRTIKILDDLRKKGSLHDGVRIGKGKGKLRVSQGITMPTNLDPSVPDHLILACALYESESRNKVIVVTRDVHLRVMCDSFGLKAQTYEIQQVIEDSSKLYAGFSEILVDAEFIARFYNNEEMFLAEEQSKRLKNNEFLMLISSSDNKQTALARYMGQQTPLKRVTPFKKNEKIWGIETRNREQTFAMDLLMDPDVPVVTLVGRAGSGKTLCAIAAGLQQTLEEERYTRLIVSRPVQPLGRDLGYLPGTMEEKMLPWLSPIQDNLQFLFGNDKLTLEEKMKTGKIEIEALTYIRGRSIANAFMIIDEAQNLTMHELKTIITRVGEGTKVVLTGDIEQIDNSFVDVTSNGLAYAVEKMKETHLSGHVTLTKGERSAVATLAAKIL